MAPCRRIALLAALAAACLAGGCLRLTPSHNGACPPGAQCDIGGDGNNTTAPAVCWDDGDCAQGQRCDTTTVCEKPPGCTDGAPCPDVCYGDCVAATATCFSDADCPTGQLCASLATGGSDRPAGPGGGSGGSGAPLPAPSGVCIDAACDTTSVGLPACPPGSEPGFDANIDPCNATCLSVDACRALTPDLCAATSGCQVVDADHCAAVDDCARLDASTCESNPSCVLKPISGVSGGSSGGGSGGTGGAPAPCDPTSDPNCGTTVTPVDVVCVPRGSDGGCLSDADCGAGETCQLSTLCGTGCETNADGTQTCFDQCWTDRGVCAPGADACSSLTPDQCSAQPGCQLVDATAPSTCTCDPAQTNCDCAPPAPAPVCLPVSTSCTSDADCGGGRHCELDESCPVCNPQDQSDLNCAAPCFVDGTCVDGAPPPVPCNTDADCGGGVCVVINVCQTCPGAPPPPGSGGSDQPAPPPCDTTCAPEGACVFPDNGLVGGAPCRTDADCADSQRCGVELSSPVCVDTGSATCLDDSQCGAGETCRFDADVCLQDPNNSTPVCSGWCAGACGNVVTPAMDPATGQCKSFPDTCIPPGWQTVASCP